MHQGGHAPGPMQSPPSPSVTTTQPSVASCQQPPTMMMGGNNDMPRAPLPLAPPPPSPSVMTTQPSVASHEQPSQQPPTMMMGGNNNLPHAPPPSAPPPPPPAAAPPPPPMVETALPGEGVKGASSTLPPSSGMIDARSPTHPTETAEERALLLDGAPGAAGRVTLLQQALACQLCPFLVDDFSENVSLDEIKDPAAGKVHVIDLLKPLCEIQQSKPHARAHRNQISKHWSCQLRCLNTAYHH